MRIKVITKNTITRFENEYKEAIIQLIKQKYIVHNAIFKTNVVKSVVTYTVIIMYDKPLLTLPTDSYKYNTKGPSSLAKGVNDEN